MSCGTPEPAPRPLHLAHRLHPIACRSMSEVMKLPLILGAISTIGGGTKEIMPVFREAVSKPFANVWISLAYTFNNLLYFDALSSISAVTYQARAHSQHGSSAAHRRSPWLTTAHRGVRPPAAGALAIEDVLHGGAHALPGGQEASTEAADRRYHARYRRCLGAVPGALSGGHAHRHRDGRLHLLGVRAGELPSPSPSPAPLPSTLHPPPSTHPHRTSALRLGLSPEPRPFASALRLGPLGPPLPRRASRP